MQNIWMKITSIHAIQSYQMEVNGKYLESSRYSTYRSIGTVKSSIFPAEHIMFCLNRNIEMTILKQISYYTTKPIKWKQPNYCPIRFEIHVCLFWLCYNFVSPIFYNVIFTMLSAGMLISTHFDRLPSKIVIRDKRHIYIMIGMSTRYHSKCGQLHYPICAMFCLHEHYQI